MSRRPRTSTVALLVALAAALAATAGGATAGTATKSLSRFVERHGSELELNGKEFRFAGSSNYYLMYKSRLMVDDVLQDADDAGFRVLRIWGSLDIGDPAVPSTSIRGQSDGVYFQYWDPAAQAPAYNDGPDGLQRLDYVIAQAGRLGLKLVIPFVNNWNDFGGMDQYVRWRDLSTPDGQTWFHDSFYTDPVIKQWYKNWISHVLNRTNTITGVEYKDDPTVMTWELGNEPRCLSAGAYGRSPDCTTSTLIRWADEMSTYIKSVDRNHLVSVGDEGFYCLPNPTHWTEDCGEGVDTVAFTRLRNVDVMSFHIYPDYWGTDVAWGVEWIKSHFRAARQIGKPAMLGEFGLQDKSLRNPELQALAGHGVQERRGRGALLDPLRHAGRRNALSGLRRLHRLLPDAGLHDDQQLRRPDADPAAAAVPAGRGSRHRGHGVRHAGHAERDSQRHRLLGLDRAAHAGPRPGRRRPADDPLGDRRHVRRR